MRGGGGGGHGARKRNNARDKGERCHYGRLRLEADSVVGMTFWAITSIFPVELIKPETRR